MNQQEQKKTCCVTGHRQIQPEKTKYITDALEAEILQAVAEGYTHFISGFAQGTDLIFASIVSRLMMENPDITLEAAIPYGERLLTPNPLFHSYLSRCCKVRVSSPHYNRRCFFIRNRAMVAASQRVLAVYDGRNNGGTRYTIRYAQSQKREVFIIPL